MTKLTCFFLLIIITAILIVPISGFAAEASADKQGILAQIGIDFQTIILQALGFLVVLLVLWKFVFGRIGGLLEERQQEITSRMEKLEADQSELDRLNAETRQRLNEIETEGQAKIQAAINESNAERQRILDQARQEASAELERARAEIQREKDEAIPRNYEALLQKLRLMLQAKSSIRHSMQKNTSILSMNLLTAFLHRMSKT